MKPITLPPDSYAWTFTQAADRLQTEPEWLAWRALWYYSAPRFSDIAGFGTFPRVRFVNAHLDRGFGCDHVQAWENLETLGQWQDRTGISAQFHGKTDRHYIHDGYGGLTETDRARLFNLRTHYVETVQAGVIWLTSKY